MNLALDETLIANFEIVLNSPPPSGRQKEQVVQDFLEENTELIPTPNLLNHQLHFEAIVSKFPIGGELVTDYLYITKSSDTWRVTLVELESPDKSIFTQDMKRTNTSAEFNAALNQVRSWKVFLGDSKAEVLRKLEPMLRPLSMRQNPIEFAYQLIMGRSNDKNLSDARKRHFRNLIQESGIDIITYDSLVAWYRKGFRYKKNVLRLSGAHYAFKYMHFEPTQILSYVGPDHLELTPQQIARLKAAGYEMDKWRLGDLLTYNHKFADSTWKAALRSPRHKK